MSTKTTIKRIALGTVAALGFGMLSAVPSHATAGTFTASAAANTSSITVVTGTGTASSSVAGMFSIDTTDDQGNLVGLFSTESITVTVVGKPTYRADGATATALGDIALRGFKTSTTRTFSADGATPASNGNLAITPTENTPSSNFVYDTTLAATPTNRYWVAFYPTVDGAIGAGAYTLRIRLTDKNSFVTDSTVKVNFVNSSADSGAAVTFSTKGNIYTGNTIVSTANEYMYATLKNADGGRVLEGQAATSGPKAPVLTAALVTSAGATESLTIGDAGTAGADYVASTTSAVATQQQYANAQDGVYGVTKATAVTSAAFEVKAIEPKFPEAVPDTAADNVTVSAAVLSTET